MLGALFFLEAGRLFECSEAGRVETALGELAAAACGSERGGRADEAADQEGARSSQPVVVIHGTIVRMRIATLGDVMLDVIVRLDQPLVPGGDVRGSTRTGAGGQAANVAAWAASLGAYALVTHAYSGDCRAGLNGCRL